MRLKFLQCASLFLLLLCCVALAPRANAQNPDTMLPEASTAKAKQVLTQLIEALGGPAYLGVRETGCAGRRALFGHSGDLTGYIQFVNEHRYPDKDRVEYVAKGHTGILGSLIGVDDIFITHGGKVITIFDGEQAWTLNRGGVVELPAADYQEQVKRNINNLIRLRLNEPGMEIRYGGTGTVDLKQVDWVELTDSEQRTFRLAVDQTTHLLVRSIVITVDDVYHQKNEEVTIYTNYQLKDGVQVALQVSRELNGRRTYQGFFDSCRINPGFADELFTRDALQKSASELTTKKK